MVDFHDHPTWKHQIARAKSKSSKTGKMQTDTSKQAEVTCLTLELFIAGAHGIPKVNPDRGAVYIPWVPLGIP